MDEERISQRLLQEQYASRVRDLSQNTSNIVLTNHAEDQMWLRHINFDLVLKALRNGQITYQELDKNGNPKLQASIFVRSRSMSVICALVQHRGRIIVITTMWDDMQ